MNRILVLFFVSAVSVYMGVSYLYPLLLYTQENVLIAVVNSSSFTRSVADHHFTSQVSGGYDIERAHLLYLKALEQNPNEPIVRYQIGRIAFIRGDFMKALQWFSDEININPHHPHAVYYMRGLTLGFLGLYESAAKEYETYLKRTPVGWAAINDYSWVLMQSGRFSDAVYALDWAHAQWPQNPWILNSRASALFELKKYNEAYADIKAAQQESDDLTSNLWSIAYPGNDPQIADEGLRHFKEAIAYNKHTIEKKINEQ